MTDLFDSKYILEVSSSGLDRPLSTEKDFRRKIGKDVKIEFDSNGKKKRVRGSLKEVDEQMIIVAAKEGDTRIALADTRKGKVII